MGFLTDATEKEAVERARVLPVQVIWATMTWMFQHSSDFRTKLKDACTQSGQRIDIVLLTRNNTGFTAGVGRLAFEDPDRQDPDAPRDRMPSPPNQVERGCEGWEVETIYLDLSDIDLLFQMEDNEFKQLRVEGGTVQQSLMSASSRNESV